MALLHIDMYQTTDTSLLVVVKHGSTSDNFQKNHLQTWRFPSVLAMENMKNNSWLAITARHL